MPLTPKTDAYIDSLPDGLDSFPECLIRTDLYDNTLEELPDVRKVPIVEQTLRQYKGRKWMPEIYGSIINHGIRDACFASDRAYFEWLESFNGKIFQRPTYKAVVMLLSTQLLLMGAAQRWSSFHKGTHLEIAASQIRGDRRVASGELVFPHGLYDELQVRTHCHAIRAAMVASRADAPEYRLLEMQNGVARLELTWRA
jgi:hypothetical protein